MIFFSYFANNPAWISSSQTIWRNIPCHNTSCSYYTSLSYGNTTTNNHIGCQPAIIFYSNWFRIFKIIKIWINPYFYCPVYLSHPDSLYTDGLFQQVLYSKISFVLSDILSSSIFLLYFITRIKQKH